MDIERIRKETRHCERFIHLNNAGAALPSIFVNQAIRDWIQEEEATGGYEMNSKYSAKIAGIYTEISKLIKCLPEEIAITDNASTAFSKALYSIPFEAGDEIITSQVEYVNNYLNYLRLKRDKGIRIIPIPGSDSQPIDLEILRNKINKQTKLIAITHMPTSSGAMLPIKSIGKMAKTQDILYLIDSCQSIGHFPIYVDEVQCDFLTATSRKYLRGPRGLGFLYARNSACKKLSPYMLESTGADWKSDKSYDLHYDAKMFECFEKPYGFLMGFQEAVKYANNVGIENIWNRISHLAAFARKTWGKVEGLQFHDGKGLEKSGIITFTHRSMKPEDLQRYLHSNSINTSICRSSSSLSDMQAKKLQTSNRLSVHYYNTEEEIESVADILRNIK